MKSRLLAGSLTAAILFAAAPAQAELLNFQLTGDADVRFQLDSRQTPSFSIDGIIPVYNFGPGLPEGPLFWNGEERYAYVIFLPEERGGGFGIGDNLNFNYSATGQVLFSGTGDAPEFTTGVWRFTDTYTSANYTLTVTSAEAAVPESSTWALMIAGVGAAGCSLRRVRKVRFATA